MRKPFVLLFLLLSAGLFFYSANAQNSHSYKGHVYHQETGDPLPGASIVIIGTNAGTSSDRRGYFELTPGNGTYRIRISSVGFMAKEVSVRIPEDAGHPVRIDLVPQKQEISVVDIFGSYNIADRDTSVDRVPLSILPATTIIRYADIEKQGAVTITEALKFVPGGWTENRGRKTKQFFSVRGQKYPYPDYSIDGIWQKEFEETVYFFSALDIESIEVVRSGSALVKGLSGLTGVIDVKTRKPDRESYSLLTKYGEQGSYLTNLRYGNKVNRVSFNASASLFGTDGPSGLNGKERMANFHGSADWEVSQRFSLSAGATYINGMRQLVDIDSEIGANNIKNRQEKYDPVGTFITYMRFNYKGGDGSETELQTNLTDRKVEFYSLNIPQETTSMHEENDSEYGFNILHSRPLSQTNTLRVGALYNHWVAPGGKRYYVGRSSNVHTFSGVVTNEQKLGKILLDAGFRLIGGHIVEWGGFGIEGSAAGFQNVTPIENEAAPIEWQSIIGGTYLLSGVSSLHYNFSGGSIAPRQGSLNNEGIRPALELRFQHDLGFRFKLPGNNELSVSSFYTKRQNAIDFSGKTVTTANDLVMELYENLDKRTYGIEMNTRLILPAIHSSLFANALLMKGEKEISGAYEDDEQLPMVIFNTGLLFDYSGFDVNLFVNYTGPYTNNRFVNPAWVQQNGNYPLGDYVSFDLTTGYTFSGRFSTRLFAEITNVLDQRYSTVAGYPDAGRLFRFGLRISNFELLK